MKSLPAEASPGYPALHRRGELRQRAQKLYELLSPCRLCPWRCKADRAGGQTGRCGASATVRVARSVPHFGEEPVLSGTRGSGTIFFSHCNLNCCYCQNYQISRDALGDDLSVFELAALMLDLQQQGCHNISLVSGSHYIPMIVDSLCMAADRGLCLPIVYNSNGYESPEMLRLLEGIVDLYLPDIKYGTDSPAEKYSGARRYCDISRAAVQEMFRQTGPLIVDEAGIARQGLIIRHLVLPRNSARTRRVLHRIKKHFGPYVAVSLMGQYVPCCRADSFPELSRRTEKAEYLQAVELMHDLEFENGWFQDCECLNTSFVPDFTKKDSWGSL
jgi:putative pyruvate formate lyase activating enzyme